MTQNESHIPVRMAHSSSTLGKSCHDQGNRFTGSATGAKMAADTRPATNGFPELPLH